MADAVEIQHEEAALGEDWLDCYTAAQILDAKYEKVDVRDVAKMQMHLMPDQQNKLAKVLAKHNKLFNRILDVYPHKKFHIDVEENAEPLHSRAYFKPKIHLAIFKKELQHLVKIGVLSIQGTSRWSLPTFIIHKKM